MDCIKCCETSTFFSRGGCKMFWNKINMKKDKELRENNLDLEELDDDDFFLAEEIDGYSSCAGINAQRCNTECFSQVMMPSITIMS